MNAGEKFNRLVEIMARLRGPDGCPWDREQTPESIRPYCIEEAYEVVEAIDEGDPKKLSEELGDLLLQVVFHARFGEEKNQFNVEGVIDSINEKLVRRHPHVFRRNKGDEASTPDEVLEKWAKIKKLEGRKHLLDGIPKALPALLRATRMGEKAGGVGFDWPDAEGVWKKVEEEMDELRAAKGDLKKTEEELGDLLYALTSLARHLKVDAESSLRMATEKFEKRFRWMEEEARKRGEELAELTADELDRLWNQGKMTTREVEKK
ncbi:MAG TPA: nucleoside triphosphate pyrophosphohydrolase [Bdellovibrionota bacterium]|nr:nucleoside triphosphate pyrophosphohydrolase [Bdellovibrionota bacterium]